MKARGSTCQGQRLQWVWYYFNILRLKNGIMFQGNSLEGLETFKTVYAMHAVCYRCSQIIDNYLLLQTMVYWCSRLHIDWYHYHIVSLSWLDWRILKTATESTASFVWYLCHKRCFLISLLCRLDFQPLFGKMSPHSSPRKSLSSGRIKDRTQETASAYLLCSRFGLLRLDDARTKL